MKKLSEREAMRMSDQRAGEDDGQDRRIGSLQVRAVARASNHAVGRRLLPASEGVKLAAYLALSLFARRAELSVCCCPPFTLPSRASTLTAEIARG